MNSGSPSLKDLLIQGLGGKGSGFLPALPGPSLESPRTKPENLNPERGSRSVCNTPHYSHWLPIWLHKKIPCPHEPP